MLKKTLAFALSAALFAFSLAGCGGNSIDSAKASDADSQEKTEHQLSGSVSSAMSLFAWSPATTMNGASTAFL